MVDRQQTVERVDHEHDDVGVARGGLGLRARALRDCIARIEVAFDSTGVDKRERAAVPFGQRIETVTRHTGRILDDGKPLTDQAVEQRALAHVGATDDRDGGGTDAQAGGEGFGHDRPSFP